MMQARAAFKLYHSVADFKFGRGRSASSESLPPRLARAESRVTQHCVTVVKFSARVVTFLWP